MIVNSTIFKLNVLIISICLQTEFLLDGHCKPSLTPPTSWKTVWNSWTSFSLKIFSQLWQCLITSMLPKHGCSNLKLDKLICTWRKLDLSGLQSKGLVFQRISSWHVLSNLNKIFSEKLTILRQRHKIDLIIALYKNILRINFTSLHVLQVFSVLPKIKIDLQFLQT